MKRKAKNFIYAETKIIMKIGTVRTRKIVEEFLELGANAIKQSGGVLRGQQFNSNRA